MKLFFSSKGYPNGPPIMAASSIVTPYTPEPVFLSNLRQNIMNIQWGSYFQTENSRSTYRDK